jgi:hypothetical protein
LDVLSKCQRHVLSNGYRPRDAYLKEIQKPWSGNGNPFTTPTLRKILVEYKDDKKWWEKVHKVHFPELEYELKRLEDTITSAESAQSQSTPTHTIGISAAPTITLDHQSALIHSHANTDLPQSPSKSLLPTHQDTTSLPPPPYHLENQSQDLHNYQGSCQIPDMEEPSQGVEQGQGEPQTHPLSRYLPLDIAEPEPIQTSFDPGAMYHIMDDAMVLDIDLPYREIDEDADLDYLAFNIPDGIESIDDDMMEDVHVEDDPLPPGWKAVMSRNCPVTKMQDWICLPEDISKRQVAAIKRIRSPSPVQPRKSQRTVNTRPILAPDLTSLVCEPERSTYGMDRLNKLVLGPLRMFYAQTVTQLELQAYPPPPGPRVVFHSRDNDVPEHNTITR